MLACKGMLVAMGCCGAPGDSFTKVRYEIAKTWPIGWLAAGLGKLVVPALDGYGADTWTRGGHDACFIRSDDAQHLERSAAVAGGSFCQLDGERKNS